MSYLVMAGFYQAQNDGTFSIFNIYKEVARL